MKRETAILYLASIILLAAAFFSGQAVSARSRVDTFHHFEAVGSGFQRLKTFIASALYLQLDDYHHIEMYQGIPWEQVTDYLPQMWLIARLDPTFTDVYADAAFHLTLNLGHVEEGMEFLREGLRHNPESLELVYEYAYLLWQTETGTPEEIIAKCMDYGVLLRRAQGDVDHPYNEQAATLIIHEVLADGGSPDPLAELYERRATFLRSAMQEGLYYPGYLCEPPPFLAPPESESAR